MDKTIGSEGPEGRLDLGRISRSMLRDQTYEFLKRSILTGKIAQGEKLNIRKLAAFSDFSSTPIRDALLKLEHDGIVVRASSGQFLVREFSRHEVERILHVRIVLETYGAAEAMKNMTEEDVIRLEENVKKSQEALAAGLLDDVSALNVEFHNYVIQVSGNEILQDLMQRISDKVWITTSKALWGPGTAENSLLEHAEITKALRDRNLRAVKQALKRHILSGIRITREETDKV